MAEDLDDDERAKARHDFGETVNTTPTQLEHWLATDESRSVGQAKDGGESVGHGFGRHVLEVEHREVADLTDEGHDPLH